MARTALPIPVADMTVSAAIRGTKRSAGTIMSVPCLHGAVYSRSAVFVTTGETGAYRFFQKLQRSRLIVYGRRAQVGAFLPIREMGIRRMCAFASTPVTSHWQSAKSKGMRRGARSRSTASQYRTGLSESRTAVPFVWTMQWMCGRTRKFHSV